MDKAFHFHTMIIDSRVRPIMSSYINAWGITNALHGIWYGRYELARCPAHDDQLTSLSSE